MNIFSERLRHKRLQKRVGHALDGVLDVIGQCRMVRWWFVKSVVQCTCSGRELQIINLPVNRPKKFGLDIRTRNGARVCVYCCNVDTHHSGVMMKSGRFFQRI